MKFFLPNQSLPNTFDNKTSRIPMKSCEKTDNKDDTIIITL